MNSKYKTTQGDEEDGTGGAELTEKQAYQYRAVGGDRSTEFQCNMTEIFFELVNLSPGYHLRLEAMQKKEHYNGGGHEKDEPASK